jgi:Domain of unknown function (DUF5666)
MRHLCSVFVVACAVWSIACSSGGPATPSAFGGATITGTIVSSGSSSLRATRSTVSSGVAGTDTSMVVSIPGTAISATVRGNRFELENVPGGHVDLQFSGGGMHAVLGLDSVQASETIDLEVSVDSTSAVLESARRSLGGEVQLEGRVESLPPTTLPLTLIVAGQLVRTSTDTKFFAGGSPAGFSDLGTGIRVHVKGQFSGPALLASTIAIQNTNADLPVLINGVVQGFSGSSSDFQFTVDGRLVKGTGATEFFGGSTFSMLANGRRVEVKGRQRDGYVFADRIHVNTAEDGGEDGGQDESSSIEGTLTSKTGGGSSLTLIVAGTTVRTTAGTEVHRRGDVQNLSLLQLGMTLHVVGDRQPDGSINARRIQINDDAAGGAFTIQGSMGGVHGTCPSLTFGMNGYDILTDASTAFTPACSTFKSGTKATVQGIVQVDGRVKATSVVRD